jgi:hypothetical protein
MKNQITHFSLVIIAFVALTLLMSYAKPAPDEPKQYIIVTKDNLPDLQTAVDAKLTEGWRLQGGFMHYGRDHQQAMVK